MTMPSREDFAPDVYTYKVGGVPRGKWYTSQEQDSIKLYPLQARNWRKSEPRHLPAPQVLVLQTLVVEPDSSRVFVTQSLDVDVFTAPIKYRPARGDFAPQLQPVLNLNAYTGYRRDKYAYHYRPTRGGFYRKTLTHVGISGGCFVGIGSEHILQDRISRPIAGEYDGFLMSAGLGIFLGLQQVTAGLLVGADRLMDGNSRFWLYDRKPWIGIGLGVNLN